MAVPVADPEDIQQCAVKLAAQQTRLMVLKDQKVALVGRIAKFYACRLTLRGCTSLSCFSAGEIWTTRLLCTCARLQCARCRRRGEPAGARDKLF